MVVYESLDDFIGTIERGKYGCEDCSKKRRWSLGEVE
jgi:hypothetical protein